MDQNHLITTLVFQVILSITMYILGFYGGMCHSNFSETKENLKRSREILKKAIDNADKDGRMRE